MPGVALPSPVSSTDAYRRQARRLRCRYASQPHRLQWSLKRLADVANARPATAPTAPAPEPSPTRATRARSYADYVEEAFPAGSSVLRYTQRLDLLRAATRFGLNRFEANLAIAAVLSRRARVVEQDEPDEPQTRSITATAAVATFVLVQGALALSVWWTLFR